MKLIVALVGILLLPSQLWAQGLTADGRPLKEALNDSAPIISAVTPTRGDEEMKKSNKGFWLTYAGVHLAMVWDGKSTFDFREREPNWREKDRLARPFVNAGKWPAYVAGTLVEGGLMYVAYKVKQSEHKTLSRTWVLIPATIIMGHVMCAIGNDVIR